jgi:hypothetical protein
VFGDKLAALADTEPQMTDFYKHQSPYEPELVPQLAEPQLWDYYAITHGADWSAVFDRDRSKDPSPPHTQTNRGTDDLNLIDRLFSDGQIDCRPELSGIPEALRSSWSIFC